MGDIVMNALTRFTVAILAVALMSGCAAQQVKNPVCDNPEYKGMICGLFRAAGMEPEEYQDVILTGIDLAMIAKPEMGKKIKEFTAALREKMNAEPWLYLSDYMEFAEAKAKALAIMRILNRHNLDILKVDAQIDHGSWELIMAHLDNIDAEVDALTFE